MYRKRLIFWSSCAGMLLFGIAVLTLGSISMDLRVKLGLDDLSSGTLFSVMPFGMLAGSLVFGPVVDRFGYKILLTISCVLLFAGFEGIANASSKEIVTLYVFFVGCGGGAINGATNALVADISETGKGAQLSLLGVFFGIGALGIPLVLGLLKLWFGFEIILTCVAILTLITGVSFLVIRYPSPKQPWGFPLNQSIGLFHDEILLLVASFLFLQSSFEGITNNWTTLYLTDHFAVPRDDALLALSAFVAGMTIMRLITGLAFRSASEKKLLYFSFALIFIGLLVLKTGSGLLLAMTGLFILGTGLAGGFPVMLGVIGARFVSLSGTAFSIVFSIALLGNIIVNYSMGIIASKFGIQHLINVAFTELVIMIFLATIILNRKSTKN